MPGTRVRLDSAHRCASNLRRHASEFGCILLDSRRLIFDRIYSGPVTESFVKIYARKTP